MCGISAGTFIYWTPVSLSQPDYCHKKGNTYLIEYLCHHFNKLLKEDHNLRTRFFSRWYLRQTLSLIYSQSLKMQQTRMLWDSCINSKEYYNWNLGRDFSFSPCYCCFARIVPLLRSITCLS